MVAMNPSPPLLLSPAQRELWARINDSASDLPNTSVHELILQRAEASPNRRAVIAARRRLTFGELAERARSLAAELVRLGHGPQAPVGISVEPGWEQVVAVLGALLAGAPIRAVNPREPQAVRWRALTDVGARTVLVQTWLDERLRWPADTKRIAVDAAEPDGPVTDSGPFAGGSSAAWLAANQGTAGPLVPITHDSLLNTVLDVNRRFGLDADDRLLAVSPLGDEISVYGLLGPLAVGAAVVIPDDIDLHTPSAWVTLMFREAVTVWLSPPALAVLLVEHLQQRGEGVPDALRLVALAGEPLVPSLVTAVRDLAGHPLRVAHPGGALPAGLWSCCHEVGDLDARQKYVPIGRPLANQLVYVLNESMSPCPVWVTGRLHFGGLGLVDAYWGEGEAATNADFVTLPESGERLYRSGLLGRLLPDGVIDMVGEDTARIDVQGHPLNLRDVEGTLAAHEAVLCAAAVADGSGGSAGFVKLVPSARVTGAELLDYLRKRMSPVLVPSRVEPVAMLPLTPSGRVDRAAFAVAAAASVATTEEPERPATIADGELTEQACDLAARVLGVPEVEPTMNLLDLGATSVQLVQLAVRAEEELGIKADVEELLRFPAVTILVSFADDASTVEEPADAVPPAPPTPTVDQEPPARARQSEAGGLLVDPVARMDFKATQPGLRRDLDTAPGVDLTRPTDDRDRLVARQTSRAFGAAAVPSTALGRLIGVLRQFRAGTEPKYGYPSAGGVYPVQTYLSVTDGRVEGVPGGAYYYHPLRHRLLRLSADAVVAAEVHAWINRDAFRSSAFSLYLVADLDAMTPMYGARARDYSLVEAGAMCQLLMTTAADIGLAVCPVGELDFAAIRDHFRLTDDHELVHTVLTGSPPDDTAVQAAARQADMLGRVDRLVEVAAHNQTGVERR